MSDASPAIGVQGQALPVQAWKRPLGRILFTFGVIFFVLGGAMACYCPGAFVTVALLAAGSICFGSLFVRLLSIVLFLAAIALAQDAATKEKQLAAKVILIKAKAAEAAAKFESTNQAKLKTATTP